MLKKNACLSVGVIALLFFLIGLAVNLSHNKSGSRLPGSDTVTNVANSIGNPADNSIASERFPLGVSRFLLDEANPQMQVEWWAYQRIDPRMRDAAVKRIQDGEVRERLGGAFSTLAYVGTNEDVAVIEEWIRTRQGEMKHPEQECFVMAMESLGLMARRRLPAANEVLIKMSSYSYWSPLKFRWYPAEFPNVQPPEYEDLYCVCIAMALADHSDLAATVDRTLANAKTMGHAIESGRFLVDDYRTIAKERLAKEKPNPRIVEFLNLRAAKEISQSGSAASASPVKNVLASENVRRIVTADTPESREIERDAVTAYERFEKAFLEDQAASVVNRLMDDLRPVRIPPEAVKSEKFLLGCRKVKQLCQAIQDAKCERRLAKDGIVVESSPNSDGKRTDETVSVTFVVQNAWPVVRKAAPDLLAGATLDREGLLIQVRRINGE